MRHEEQTRLIQAQAAIIADLRRTVLMQKDRITTLEREKDKAREEVEWVLYRARIHRLKQSKLFRYTFGLVPGSVKRGAKRVVRGLLGR